VGFTVVIPARLASTRLPNKALADIGGRPMVVRVAERAASSSARAVVVATDHADIAAACARHGVRALMTRADHASGSDRLAEAATLLALADDEIVLNVQGDEPLIEPALIDACAALLAARADCVMATAAHAIDNAADQASPNVVKVVLDAAGRALYFSRSPLPCWRDRPSESALPEPPPLRHVGLYAYRAAFLRRFPTLPMAPIERLEALEQLRVLWHGERIAVHVAARAPGPGVDTAEDLARVRQLFTGLP
jgi:3-deoxy-manno-octulosonate cytidylyltransferase (CMP-KDO synthetase)